MSGVKISSEAFAELSAQIFENAGRLKSRDAQKYARLFSEDYTEETTLRPQDNLEKPKAHLRGKPVSLHNYAQTYLGPDAVYSLHSLSPLQTAAGLKQYAELVYNTTVSLNEEPKVLLDFMHKNNQTYDFKIWYKI